jgi:hypothetical protein
MTATKQVTIETFKTNASQLSNELNDLLTRQYVKIAKLEKDFPKIDKTKDFRLVTMHLLIRSINSERFAMSAIANFKSDDPNFEISIEDSINSVTETLFVSLVVRLEHFFRLLYENKTGSEEPKFTLHNFAEYFSSKKTGLISSNQKDLLMLIKTERNTVHNGGVYNSADCSLDYNGKTYQFKKNEPSAIFIPGFIDMLLDNSIDLLIDITQKTLKMNNVLIWHPYSAYQFAPKK